MFGKTNKLNSFKKYLPPSCIVLGTCALTHRFCCDTQTLGGDNRWNCLIQRVSSAGIQALTFY